MTLIPSVNEIIALLKKAESAIRDPIDYGSPVTLHGALILVKEIDRLRELVKTKDEAIQKCLDYYKIVCGDGGAFELSGMTKLLTLALKLK